MATKNHERNNRRIAGARADRNTSCAVDKLAIGAPRTTFTYKARAAAKRSKKPVKQETLAEYLARGGEITKVQAGEADG